MKRIFILLLALALILPAAALAADPDPIVGCWYIYFDTSKLPTSSISDKIDREIVILYIRENGDILALSADFKDSEITENHYAIGKWEKTSDGYTTSILGVGKSDAHIKNDCLEICIYSDTYYVRFSRLDEQDVYSISIFK